MKHEPKLDRMAGPILLWGLGVGYVISGDYYGWNSGLLASGYWGFLLAIGVAALLYGSLTFVMAELAAALPDAGGPSAFTRLALGGYWGYFCAIGVLIEYIFASAAVAVAVGAYLNFLEPAIPPLATGIGVFVLFTVIHLYGVSTSLKLELGLTGVAVLMLIVFYCIGAPHLSLVRLDQIGHGAFLPRGLAGLWGAFPAAAWLFLGIEGLPMAAEEARHAARDLPRALIASFATLFLLAAITPAIAAGLGGATAVGKVDAPLLTAVEIAFGSHHWLAVAISVVGLAALAASFHAIVFSYSRQIYALSRIGYLPGFFTRLNRRKAPGWALVVPGLIGIALVVIGSLLTERAIPIFVTVSVWGAAISYMMMASSAIVLHRRSGFVWPFRMAGGEAKAWIALGLSILLFFGSIYGHPAAGLLGTLVLIACSLFYLVYTRSRVRTLLREEDIQTTETCEASSTSDGK